LREYVAALRAIWRCWQDGTPLAFEGEHYRLNLMNSLFTPEPLPDPRIPVHLAAVNPYMCQVAGEVADGLRPHPVCTPHYIRSIMLPAVARGAARTGRALDGFAIAMKPLVATAPDRASLAARIADVRARVSFYASTPAYQACFDAHGLGDLARELQGLSKAQRWDEMAARITDEVLDLYATVGTYDEIVPRLVARYGGLVTSLEFSIQVRDADEREVLAGMVTALRAA
jgi:probable F420-dependent oxidoreductase